MFGSFRKKRTAAERAEELFISIRPFYRDVLEVVEHVDGKFPRLHEAGLFVASIVMHSLDRVAGSDANDICVSFGEYWLVYLTMNPHEAPPPTLQQLNTRLQEKHPIYERLLNNILMTSPNHEDGKSPEVMLAWELFTNCTDQNSPTDFLKLMIATKVLCEVVAEIHATVKAKI